MIPLNHILKDRSLQKKAPDYTSVSAIRTEIRTRRKHILGSHVSIFPFVCNGDVIDDTRVDELSQFLTEKTVCFWDKRDSETQAFCYRFYNLAFYALASGNVGDDSIDDVIQLAECLVRSKDIYLTVVRSLLPANMVGELFRFAEEYDDSFFTATFEDAVLGAVAVLVGALADPMET